MMELRKLKENEVLKVKCDNLGERLMNQSIRSCPNVTVNNHILD